MKNYKYILPFCVWFIVGLTGILIWSCNVREEPVRKIYKAKPENAPVKKESEEEILKPEKAPASTDSIAPSDADYIIPSDSVSKSIQDTTETLQQMEKKIEIKTYKKIYLHNLHRKPPVS